MYVIEKEIESQFDAMEKTIVEMERRKKELNGFLAESKKIVVFGCGSSYSLAKSAAAQMVQLADIPAYAIAAGDYLVNADTYDKVIRHADIIAISRSGSTSEMLRAVTEAKKRGAKASISFCAAQHAPIADICDCSVELPWCFDHAVCQTRTVTNLYAAVLLMAAHYSRDTKIIKAFSKVGEAYVKFCEQYNPMFKEIASGDWTHAVVLADSMAAGLAQEASLAFKEICQDNSNFYHMLDLRHGPMVMVKPDTLVLLFITSENEKLQKELLRDIGGTKARTAAFYCGREPFGAEYEIMLPDMESDFVKILFMMYGVHKITLEKAALKKVNPDKPEGLDAWIRLEE